MLLSSAALPSGGQWAAEVKWDGIRLQARIDGDRVVVRSRPGRECTDVFPELSGLAGIACGRSLLLDGELVCLADDGAPDFDAVRARLVGNRRRGPVRAVTFMVFDVLHADGRAV